MPARNKHYIRLTALLLIASKTDEHEFETLQLLWIAIMAQIDVFAKCKAAGTTTTKLPSLSMLSLTDANKNWGSSP
ncbi:hypothetical protein HDU99_009371 [Rhizoclosmatium hyalinum]|nr:hypothetical protein HDU99_009371 [Rhizoclosmatium hyalinum]